ncbi:MAG: MbnP family protein [Flavobacteriales bacterium]|jgi:hypothetical protein
MRIVHLVLFLGITLCVSSQKHVFLHVTPKIENQPFALNTVYYIQNGPTIRFDHFNYYFSDVRLYHDAIEQTDVLPAVHLMKPDTFSLYLGELWVNQLDSIQFMIGVPQRMNTQTGQQALDISTYPENHPLSFQSPSMYWGWLFGYMHMIMGGDVDSDNDLVPDTYFELHNLGDHNQKVITMPVIQTNTANDQIDIYMECHIDQWIRSIPLESIGISHGETAFNDVVMSNVLQYPVFVQPIDAGIGLNHQTSDFYFSNGQLHWNQLPLGKLRVFNVLGQCVREIPIESSNGELPLLLNQGTYLIKMFDSFDLPLTSKKHFYSHK